MLRHDPHALIAQPKAHDHVSLEWIADSGAGRDLASRRAFSDQGIPSSVIQNSTQTSSPIKFETGNGYYTADSCVSLNGPIVRSLGQIVASGKPFIWLPDQLPFFCQDGEAVQMTFDSTKNHTASRVEDYSSNL